MNSDAYVIPIPQFPQLIITPKHVQFHENAGQEERDLAHGEITDIFLRAREACQMWEQSVPFPEDCQAGERFQKVAEYGNTVLAVRNDGNAGLHFVTWDYSYGRTGVTHGHYTRCFADAKEDFAVRAGLVDESRIIHMADVPLLYKALRCLDSEDVTLTSAEERRIDALCDTLKQMDPDVITKAYPAEQSQNGQVPPALGPKMEM